MAKRSDAVSRAAATPAARDTDEEQRIEELPGRDAWKPEYEPSRGTKELHAEAYRRRAGMIGTLASCICTWPIEIDDTTASGHAPACPSNPRGFAMYLHHEGVDHGE